MDRLIEVFNTLLRVETKGESTIIMADCLRALRAIIEDKGETNE